MVVVTRRDAENYRFLRLYSIDLEMARQSCDLIARQDALDVRYCLLRDLVVSYARPFSSNRGRVFKRHRLEKGEVVPIAMRPLHAELLALRDQAFAHTDHDFRNPQIARWPRSSGGATYGMSFRNPAYDTLIVRLQEIRDLATAVEQRVNALARDFELTFDQLYPEETQPVTEPDGQPSGA